MDKKGFTLIEIIVTVAVLAVLTAIAVISLAGITNEAKEKACFANIKNVEIGAITNSIVNDEDALFIAQIILEGEDNKYFPDDIVCPSGGEYTARYDNKTGELVVSCSVHGELAARTIAGTKWLVFSDPDFNMSSYLHSSFYKVKDGMLTGSYGLFLADVEPSDHYVVEILAKLSGGGGYGMLIETASQSISNDTGYAVQFDKTLNKSLVIRKRTNGSEGSPLYTIPVGDFIPEASADSWWNQEHVFSTEVKKLSETQSIVIIKIDGVQIGTGDLLIDRVEGANKIGLRSWHSETSYSYLDYTVLD